MKILMISFFLSVNIFLQVWSCNSMDHRNSMKSTNIISKINNNDDNSSDVKSSNPIDLMEVMSVCNESFHIPMEYLEDFNQTGTLADENDKTSMCYLRCYFERTNMINNGEFIPEKVKEMWWPATGDSVNACNQEGMNETNSCKTVYMKAKCLMLRALVDGRNKESA